MKKLAIVLGAVFVYVSSGQVSVSVAAKKKFQSSNWVTACKNTVSGRGRICRMSRAIREVGDAKPMLVTAVQRDLNNKGYMLVLRLPHGLNLPAGIHLQVDKQKARRIAVLSSDRGGAFTRVNLPPNVLATLKKGRQLTVSFGTIGGQRLVIPVSLSGFTGAFNRLAAMR